MAKRAKVTLHRQSPTLFLAKLQWKAKQVEAIRVVYERRDVFVWLPTGICLQVLPYVFDFKLGRSCTRSTSHDRYNRKVALYNILDILSVYFFRARP